MTTLGGFDPSRSLLPAGGGTIHVMSGGSMTSSLLPEATGRIHVMTGGVDSMNVNQPQQVQNQGQQQVQNQAQSPVQQQVQNQGQSPVQQQVQNQAQSPVQQQVQNQVQSQQVQNQAQSQQVQNQGQQQVQNQGQQQVQNQGQQQVQNQAQSQNKVNGSQEEKKEEPNGTNKTVVNNKPKRKPEEPLSEDEKRVTLFGERLVLKKPRNNSTTFSEDQKHVFKLFGLQSASVDMKRSVLQALYDGSCDTNRSLITMRACEPFRQIVRSLALRYLNKMNGEYVEEEEQEEKPSEQEEQEESPSKKILMESPSQGKNSEEIEAMGKVVESMAEGLIPVLGIKNPDAVSCYCISTVQFLFLLPEVRSAILSYNCKTPLTDELMAENPTKKDLPVRVVCSLKDVFSSLAEGMTTIDAYQKPSDPKTISDESAKRIQYLMRIFNRSKGQEGNPENDASEFLEFVIKEMIKVNELTYLYDYIGLYNQVFYTCQVASANQNPEPIEDEHNQVKVPLIRLGVEQHQIFLQKNPEEFKEERASNTISVNALIQSYQFAIESTQADAKCGAGSQHSMEKHQITPSPESRYVILQINKPKDQKITVSPFLTFENTANQEKRYVFMGAIQYAERELNKHYLFHAVDYAKIKEQNMTTIEGVPYVNYGTYGGIGDVFKGTTDEEYPEYKLSLQAHLLVYRSEDAMEQWKTEVEEKKKELETKQTTLDKKEKEEPMPTLSSGKPYQDELRSKMPAELIEVMNEIETLSKDFFKDYDIKIEEIDAKIKAFTPLVDDLATQIQSYLDQYKNNKSSDEQKAAFEAIEQKVVELNQKSEEIQRLLFEQPKSQEEIVSISTYIESKRAEVLQKKYELERSSIGLTTTFRMEDDKDIQDGQKWINLYPILHVRFEDRKAVMAPVKESNQQLDTLLKEISEKKNIIRANTEFFVEEVQKKLKDLVESISENAGNYCAEFIGQAMVDKTGQEWYDEMVATEEYKAIQRTIDENREKIQGDLSSFSSTVSSVEDEEKHANNPLGSSSGSSSSTSDFVIPEEEQPPIELSDIEEAHVVSQAAPAVDQEAPAVSQAAPAVDQEAPAEPKNNSYNNMALGNTFMSNKPAEPSQGVEEAPAEPKNNSHNNMALGNTFMSNQQGGATSEELVSYLERQQSVYEKMKNQLDSILDTKRRYIDEYEHKHIQIPFAELSTKSYGEKEENDKSDTLKPITRLQRNIIRLDALHVFQTAQKEFWRKVMDDNQTEHSTLQLMVDTVSHSYRAHLEQSKSDLANAYYRYLLHRSGMEPDDSLKDIHKDVTQAYHADQAKMKEWTSKVFKTSDLDQPIKDLASLIKTYNETVQSKAQYEQLPVLRKNISEMITNLGRTIREKGESIPTDTMVQPSLFEQIMNLDHIYEHNKEIFLGVYDTFHSRRPFTYLNQKEIQIVSDAEKDGTKAILEEITQKLEKWKMFFIDYDKENKNYLELIKSAKRQLIGVSVLLSNTLGNINHDSIKNTTLPANYAEKYKEKLLEKKIVLLNSLDDMKEIDPTHQNEVIQTIDKEIEEDQAQLDTDEKEFIHNPEHSEPYLQTANEMIKKYDMKKDRIKSHMAELEKRKTELENEKKAVDEYEKWVSETIEKDAATNQSRVSLEDDSTSLLKVVEELRVRLEVQGQIKEKKDALTSRLQEVEKGIKNDGRLLTAIDQLKQSIETKKDEIIEMAYTHRVLKEQQDFLGAAAVFSNEQKVEQNADRQRQLEELQSKINAARVEVKLQKKIQRVQEVIQDLEKKKEAVPNENHPQIEAVLEEKRKKLRSLEELMAEQVRLRGTLPRNNKRIANTKTYPEKKEEEEEEKKEKLPLSIQLSEQIQGYLKDMYQVPDEQLTPEMIKKITTNIKRMKDPTLSIQQIIDGDDLFHTIFRAANISGVTIFPPQNKYLTLINQIHDEYTNDQSINIVQRVMSHQDTVIGIDVPDNDTDYINLIHNELETMNDRIDNVIKQHDMDDQSINNIINQTINSIQSKKKDMLKGLAHHYEKGKMNCDEYISYRLHLELLFALTENESPLKQDLIQFYQNMYKTAKEAKEEAERNRLAKQAEQEKKEQEEKDRLERHKANHYKGIKSTVKTLLRDMRSHISDIQKIKNPPKELTDLSVELKGIDDIIQTYTREYKNAIDKSAPVFTSRISREIESALKKLDPYLESNVLRKLEYSSIYKTISTLSRSSQEIVEYIQDATNANRENNKKNKTAFNNKYRQEEERMEQEKKEAEEKKQREEREAEEARIAAEKAAANKAAAEQAERERIASEKAAANKAAAEKAERNRVAAIRAQKEKEHKTQLDQLSRQIEAKKKEKEEIEDKLKDYNAVKDIPSFQVHYDRLKTKKKSDGSSKINRAIESKVEKIRKFSRTPLNTLKGLRQVLKNVINPDMARLETEIKGLEQQREKLLSGENNGGDEKVPEDVMSETNMIQAKKNTEHKTNEIQQMKEDMTTLDFITRHLPRNGSVKGDQLNSLIDMMRKYKFLNSSSQRMFEQDARQSYEKVIQTIASFRDQLEKVISNNELQIDDLQTKITKAERKLRETPTYQLKNREALEKIESKLTRDTINNSMNKSISIIKHYPDVSEEYIHRLTTIKDDPMIASDVKVKSLSTILQQFIQHLADEYEKHPPLPVSNKNIKVAEYLGRYPGRSNQKPATQSKPKRIGTRGGSRHKKKLKGRTRKVKK